MCRAWNKKIKTNIKFQMMLCAKVYLYVGIPQFFIQLKLCKEILKTVSISENMFRHIVFKITTREPVRINSEVKQDLMWVFLVSRSCSAPKKIKLLSWADFHRILSISVIYGRPGIHSWLLTPTQSGCVKFATSVALTKINLCRKKTIINIVLQLRARIFLYTLLIGKTHE